MKTVLAHGRRRLNKNQARNRQQAEEVGMGSQPLNRLIPVNAEVQPLLCISKSGAVLNSSTVHPT